MAKTSGHAYAKQCSKLIPEWQVGAACIEPLDCEAGETWVRMVEHGSGRVVYEAKAMQRVPVQLSASESHYHGLRLSVNLLHHSSAKSQQPPETLLKKLKGAAEAIQR